MKHKPFTKDWWWQKLLDHQYYSKWKYYDKEEMEADYELTEFIQDRIERCVIKEHIKKDIYGRAFCHKCKGSFAPEGTDWECPACRTNEYVTT